MNVHKNARLTPRGRERIVRQVASGQTPEAVADGGQADNRVGALCPRWATVNGGQPLYPAASDARLRR